MWFAQIQSGHAGPGGGTNQSLESSYKDYKLDFIAGSIARLKLGHGNPKKGLDPIPKKE
jgi:hypothetical protein